MKRQPFSFLGVLGFGPILVVVVMVIGAFIVLAACMPEETVPAQPSGVELDIDRAKPRPPLKQPKAPKAKTGSKR